MNLAAGIEALRAEVDAARDEMVAAQRARTGLRVLCALLQRTQPADLATEGAAPRQPVAATADNALLSSAPAPAAAAPDAGGPPPHRGGRPPLASWTATRLALLPRYATDDVHDLLREINALPGAPVTLKALRNKALQRGIQRRAAAQHAARSAAMQARMQDDAARAAHAERARAALAERRAHAGDTASTPSPEEHGSAGAQPDRPAANDRLREKIAAALAAKEQRWTLFAAKHRAPLREVYRIKGEIERAAAEAAADA